jgi:hypothetical protein
MKENLLKGIQHPLCLKTSTATDCNRIKALVYHIAEERTLRQLYVHNGIRCEQCGQCPILGVRWHCNNCPDFDLCSACESQPLHPRTHVFTKIKVPISFLGQNYQVQDVSYPGEAMAQWPVLRNSLKRRLAVDSGFEDLQVQVLYDQFACKANSAYPEVRSLLLSQISQPH